MCIHEISRNYDEYREVKHLFSTAEEISQQHTTTSKLSTFYSVFSGVCVYEKSLVFVTWWFYDVSALNIIQAGGIKFLNTIREKLEEQKKKEKVFCCSTFRTTRGSKCFGSLEISKHEMNTKKERKSKKKETCQGHFSKWRSLNVLKTWNFLNTDKSAREGEEPDKLD